MIKPPLPLDESQRLQTLRNLRLLDTPPEERFDRVTRLARSLFDTEIALVSLVDADRQWFKSKQGLDVPETHRDISFCGHAVLDDKIMVVNDAAEDIRFRDNPLVCESPNIRFYAGYPLAAPDGARVGTLCIIDSKPKELSAEQRSLLRELGRMVEEELIAASNATIDPATNLSSRKGFLPIADHLLSLCRRRSEPATLLLFHLEDLQALEDRAGRYEGDTMIVELAHMLMAGFRESDIVARVAHDMFCVLQPVTHQIGAEEARRRFDNQLNSRNRDASRPHELRIEVYATSYDENLHPNAEALLRDGEAQVVSAIRQRIEELSDR